MKVFADHKYNLCDCRLPICEFSEVLSPYLEMVKKLMHFEKLMNMTFNKVTGHVPNYPHYCPLP